MPLTFRTSDILVALFVYFCHVLKNTTCQC